MNICIFCSAYVRDKKYSVPAEELAVMLAQAGHNLVWGGSDVGLMKVVARAFRDNGGKLYGFSLEAYRDKAHKTADEMAVFQELGERKSAMLSRADAVIALPGGIGTLDELGEVFELKKQAKHSKPIVLFNTDNFYAGLISQFERMEQDGFLPVPVKGFIFTSDSARDVIDYVNKLA